MGAVLNDTEKYQRTEMERESILQKLKKRGCRITRQRRMLLDVILEGDCSCCKEIYYKASQADAGIGIATVYRMINSLEEIGAISRRNIYKIQCEVECEYKNACIVELDDDTRQELSQDTLNRVLLAGLQQFGYVKNQKIKNVVVNV